MLELLWAARGPFGCLDAVHRNCGVGATGPQPSTTYGYDLLGRLETETDPAFGTRAVTYTAFDQVAATVDAEGQVVFSHYDDLGRRISEVSPEGFSSWSFDSPRTGALRASKVANDVIRIYSYDDFGRLSREQTVTPSMGNQAGELAGQDVTVDYEYGLGDRLSAIEFEEDMGLRFSYDAAGYHRSTQFYWPTASGGVAEELVWGWEASDANTSLAVEAFGTAPLPADRTRTERLYDPATGRLEASTTATGGSNVQAYSFGWTPAGDLDWRLDSHNGQAEEFEHDSLHRLIESEVAGVVRDYTYDALGNFTTKDGVGTYTYDTDGTRLLYTSNGTTSTTYHHDNNGAVEHFGNTDIQWTSFGKVEEITQDAETHPFTYDADGARVARQTSEGFTVTPHHLYERRFSYKGELQELRVKAPSASGAVVAEFRFEPAHPEAKVDWFRKQTRYIHDDHLGSAGLTTDETGAEVERVAYDPWGRARDADDWNAYLADDATDELPIGFTGHQAELDGGLINMRGRMYDPRLGRFMSVDPIIENATNVQTWNSYSYVQNRPLSAVDPSGLGAGDSGGDDGGEPSIGGSGDNIDCGQDESTASGCQRTITVHTSSESMSGGPGNDAPIGGNWGGGDGSGAGMRGGNALELIGNENLAAPGQAEDELAYQEMVRQVSKSVTLKGLRHVSDCKDDTCRALESIGSEGGTIKLPAAATAETDAALEDARRENKGRPAAEGLATWVSRLMSGGTEELILLTIEGESINPLDRGPVPLIKGPKQRNKPPGPDPNAGGRPHSRVERPGRDGQYTTHYGDGSWKQYWGSGKAHGNIPRPNVKEMKLHRAPDGRTFPGKPRVRPPTADEIPSP